MIVAEKIHDWFKTNKWTWKISGESVEPGLDDIEKMLDEAAKTLYDEPVGTQLEVGRLIVKKLHRGHEVYIFVDEYL